MGKNMNSPAVLPSHQQNDVEAGTYKDAPIQRINRWRQARNALCACQFWHILYLKKEGGQASNTVHAHAAAEHALATETGEEVIVNIRTSTNGEDDDVVKRKGFFGANTYPAEKSKRFLACLLEACHQDIYTIIVAVASSVMGLVTKGTRFGYWEEGGNVVAVVMVNIIVKAICKCSQSQIHNVKEKGRNMYLKEFLNWVASSTGKVGLAVAFAAMSVLFLRWFTGDKLDGNPKFTGVKTKLGDIIEEVNKIINVSFTIAVVAVPQGLPLAVTLNILSATKRMVVRRPFACETLAFVKNFLCDKTLLTLNEMSVVEAYAGGKKIDLSDDNMPYVSSKLSSLITEGIAWNTEGDVHATKSGVDDSGSPTDKAILRWGICKLGMKVEEKSQSPVLKVVPFDSEKKRRAVALQLRGCEVRVHWKGDPQLVLSSCTQYIDDKDDLVAMNDDKLMFFQKAIKDMAAGGLHCVAIACRSYEFENVPTHPELLAQWELPEDDLVLLAIAGIRDLCQPLVKEDVQLFQSAGVKVRMVTGDNLPTAKAIALECGILDSDADATMPNHLFDGREFVKLNDDGQRQEYVQRIKVMAWCSPDVKLLFVQALKKNGEMVAVTGYVTDDAPALHQADIGFAMGIGGTEVAKESSDIIILDDNFATCAKAFQWGRSGQANIIKFMQLQLTVIVVALSTNFTAAVYYGHVPLNAVQILWVNLLIVALVPRSLVTNPPADELMPELLVEPGQPPKRYIKWKRLIFQGVYQIVAILIINFQGWSLLKSYTSSHAIKVKNTMIFNTFVVCQIIHQMEARKKGILSKPKKWITSNYLFMGIAGTILISQFIIIEFLGKAFSTVALNQKEWQFSLTLGFFEMLFAIILFVKYLTHRN